jgi:predicted DNA repair protein MutK
MREVARAGKHAGAPAASGWHAACGTIPVPDLLAPDVAASSLLALLDDIASVLDDVSMLTKVATQKTAGVLGDDLALNAQQVAGVRAERELPVVLSVAKGSAINKAILVPAALAISAVIPWAVMPLLMAGGLFLCYEGFEKVAHKLLHSRAEDHAHRQAMAQALTDPNVDLVQLEKTKIKGAVRTDFILSAEIITIALGIVADASLVTRIMVLVGVAIIMTIGVYGLVAGIVKLDDAGLYLTRRSRAWQQQIGRAILRLAPYLMKGLSVAGTLAMFLVGGGILTHGIDPVHHAIEVLGGYATDSGGAALGWSVQQLANVAAGVVAGGIAVGVATGARKLWSGARGLARG